MSRGKHDKLWIEFLDWCRERQLKALPAHAWTVAAYLRWREKQFQGKADFVSADRVIKIISRAHLLTGYKSPHDHPVIAKTIASIARTRTTTPDRSDLFSDKDFAATPKTARTPSEPEPDDDEEPPEEPPQVVSGIRTNFSLRTQPKLVSRRPNSV
ncbi:MAG: hypothetical protein HN644_02630 [Rhodospirillales bacterium]|jgi:hypothetical protein|nr:hypothetical protein [Rhodospirillales bacterium]MBT4040007.1 hypothetical protein [Rhodospirillales bacterium]MBT4625191.1 hypothetical protein [Rhodospirillales bacterium]MBT5351434.1 hypothetical protein [Rhodospirillales bacterium]MBT5521977.1 hypothetical protein [Rhodospirillales bacterium]